MVPLSKISKILYCLLKLFIGPPIDHAIHCALTLAPPIICSATAHLPACDDTSITPLNWSSPSTCHTSHNTRPIRPDPASAACNEDAASAIPST